MIFLQTNVRTNIYKYVKEHGIQGIHLIANWALISKPVTQVMVE